MNESKQNELIFEESPEIGTATYSPMEQENYTALGNSTYCMEDDKLRFYPFERLEKDVFERIKKAGFLWAPKQGLFVKPRWTPSAEDLLLELCGDIEDEDKTPEDRAAERAERFSIYRDKRRDEAGGYADKYDQGPSVIGCQSADRAERIARRFARIGGRAVSQWDKAEYWQQRTKGVISNALHKAAPATRRARILKIENDQRANQRDIDQVVMIRKNWLKVQQETDLEKAQKLAGLLADRYGFFSEYQHPRKDKKAALYFLMNDKEDPISAKEAANLYLKTHNVDPESQESKYQRWSNHYALRIAYEKQMLESEGGSAADVEMIPGGFIGKHQIQKVNRSTINKRVVSVVLLAPHPYNKEDKKLYPKSFNIQRLPSDAYRPPTAEELEAFNYKIKGQKERNKADREANPGPKLINPTVESAQKLMDAWNARAKSRLTGYQSESYKDVPLTLMTQDQYKNGSVGAYAKYKAEKVDKFGELLYGYRRDTEQPFVKVRARYWEGSGFSNAPYSIIIITDKKQEPLPTFKQKETVDNEKSNQTITA